MTKNVPVLRFEKDFFLMYQNRKLQKPVVLNFSNISKTNAMETIKITDSEEILFNDLKEGNSVQLRVNVPKGSGHQYSKGEQVKVVFGKQEAVGKIVSEPLVVQTKVGEENETISLMVEKS